MEQVLFNVARKGYYLKLQLFSKKDESCHELAVLCLDTMDLQTERAEGFYIL